MRTSYGDCCRINCHGGQFYDLELQRILLTSFRLRPQSQLQLLLQRVLPTLIQQRITMWRSRLPLPSTSHSLPLLESPTNLERQLTPQSSFSALAPLCLSQSILLVHTRMALFLTVELLPAPRARAPAADSSLRPPQCQLDIQLIPTKDKR
jgi:hypothetical protein